MRNILASLLLALCIVFLSSCSRLPREKVWIYYPGSKSTVGMTAAIEGRAYDRDGIVLLQLQLRELANGETEVIPLSRLASVYKGEIREQLSKFRQQVVFPRQGSYELTVLMSDTAGNNLISKPVLLESKEGKSAAAFRMFSTAHLIPLVILAVLGSLIIFCANRFPKLREIIPWMIGVILWGNEIFLHLADYLIGAWSVTSNLLLHLCGLSVLLCPVMLLHPQQGIRKALFPLMYFWGLGAALQALLTPDIGVFGFPSHRYFTIFISHGFIIIAVLYMIAVEKYRVTLKDMARVYLISTVIIVPIYVIDMLLKRLPPYEAGCYFFLAYPPVDGSAIDLLVAIFGPSPYYIIGLMLLGIAVFFILTVPFLVFGKNRKSEA